MDKEIENLKRKRINYLVAEDFYLTTLIAIILLKELKTSSKKSFQDFSKIAYLSEFVLDSTLIKLLKQQAPLSSHDKDRLLQAFSRGEVRLAYLSKIGLALEKKKLIGMEINHKKKTVDWFLNVASLPKDFYDTDLFSTEIDNAKELVSMFSRIRTVSVENVRKNLFKKFGIIKWQD